MYEGLELDITPVPILGDRLLNIDGRGLSKASRDKIKAALKAERLNTALITIRGMREIGADSPTALEVAEWIEPTVSDIRYAIQTSPKYTAFALAESMYDSRDESYEDRLEKAFNAVEMVDDPARIGNAIILTHDAWESIAGNYLGPVEEKKTTTPGLVRNTSKTESATKEPKQGEARTLMSSDGAV